MRYTFHAPLANFQLDSKFQNRNSRAFVVVMIEAFNFLLQLRYAEMDLSERTFLFARNVVTFCKALPPSMSNLEYSRQVLRSSASVGANYLEGNDALSKKDFVCRIRICRNEAKESAFFLRLLGETNDARFRSGAEKLQDEAVQLKKIFSSILLKM